MSNSWMRALTRFRPLPGDSIDVPIGCRKGEDIEEFRRVLPPVRN
jgi:hypothetical protein